MTENSGESLSIAAASMRLAAGVFAFDLWTLLGLYLFSAGPPVTVVLINRSFGLLLFLIAVYSVAPPRAQGQMPEEGRGTPSRHIVASTTGAGLLLVLLVVASYQTTMFYQRSAQVIAHPHNVLNVLATFITPATGQRGFMLTTGHDTYLEPYNRTLIQLDERIQRLKTLTQDIPVQENGFPALEAKIAEKPDDLRETVMARWNEGPGAVFRIVMGDQGTTTMDEIRSALAEMEGIEHGLLVEWRQLPENMFLAMLLYLGLGGLLQIGLLVAAGLFVPQPQIADQVRIKSETAMHEALVLLRGTRAIAPNLVTVGHAI